MLDDDSALHVLTFLHLDEVSEALRSVSMQWNRGADKRRALHRAALNNPAGCCVRVIGLQSAVGQLVNGKIGAIQSWSMESGRYSVAWQRADGTIKQIKVKPRNAVPLCIVAFARVAHRFSGKMYNYLPNSSPIGLVCGAYNAMVTRDHPERFGCIDFFHGVMEDMALMAGRWFTNEDIDHAYGRRIPQHEFFQMNRSDPRMHKLSTSMWTHWELSCGAAYNHRTLRELVEANLVLNIARFDPPGYNTEVKQLDSLTARRDGAFVAAAAHMPSRALLCNTFRFIRSWATERVSAPFYIVRDSPNGTLLVKALAGPPQVFLALGGFSRIGALTLHNPDNHRLQVRGVAPIVRLTLLPLYHFCECTSQWWSGAHGGVPGICPARALTHLQCAPPPPPRHFRRLDHACRDVRSVV